VHLTETCDTGQPDLITQVLTTPAPTHDRVLGPIIHRDLAPRDLLPRTPRLDRGCVDADLLVTAHTPPQLDVLGPPFGSYSRQQREGAGDDLQACIVDWEAAPARCPQGHLRGHWRPGHEGSGGSVIRLRCDGATCRACPTRRACTSAQGAPRQLTVRWHADHEASQAARQRQAPADFQVQDAVRAGVESSRAPGGRRVDLRRSRELGVARMHLQPRVHATAMKVVRVSAWRWGES
jgi:transposase